MCFSAHLVAQNNDQISIQDALLEIAKEHRLSLVFNSDNIPNRNVTLPNNSSSSSQLQAILRDTNLEYRIESNQIFLFVKRNIYGYIEDATSGERLIAATMFLPETRDYAVSNEQGYFALTTIEDVVVVEVSYLGYTTHSQTLTTEQMGTPIVLQLTPDADLREVIISDLAVTAVDQSYIELNKGTDILLHQNQAVSSIGGEPDIFQAMMRQTGVNSGTDGIGGMHVRGGKNDQNLILFDGVKLYNSAHAFGAFSLINSETVDQAKLFKSGASGSRFGRLSSIMDVKTKDPNLAKIKASIQASTIASQASLELPLIKDHLGVMVTGRRTHVDPYIRSKSSDSKFFNDFSFGETNYNFNDINVKALAKINARHRFYLSLYRGQDRYDDDDFFDDLDFGGEYLDQVLYYDWKNQFASMRYNILLGAKTIANVQLSTYDYSYVSFLEVDETVQEEEDFFFSRSYQNFESGVQHDELKIDLQTITDRHQISYGIVAGVKNYNLGELTLEEYEFEPDYTQILPIGDYLITELIGNYESREMTVYLSDKFKLSNSWLIDGGVYFTIYNNLQTNTVDDDPEYQGQNLHGYLKSLYQVNDNFSFGGSIGSYLQTEHLLTTGDNGYPNDIWVPSTKDLPAERSNQIELFTDIKSNNHSLRLSTYIKQQQNILFYDTIRALSSLTNLETDYLEEVLESGNSMSYGTEVNYSYIKKGKFALNAAYTFGKTDYQFDQLNEGKSFPFDYSIPHTFSVGSNIFLSRRWTFSLDWYYASGKPYTLYNSLFAFSPLDRDTEVKGDLITVLGNEFNDQRLPASHKLSFSFSTYWQWGKTRSDLLLGVQNAYNRKNVIYEYELDGVGIQQQLGLAILPMVRWKIGF